VLPLVDEIRSGSDAGVRGLMTAMRWAGNAFHAYGWNPRPIEGVEHFVFYALERRTGRKFIHGQPVCLGVVVGLLLHGDRPGDRPGEPTAEEVIDLIQRAGVDIRPEAMGVTWGDVEATLCSLGEFVREAGLWYGIAHEAEITPRFVAELRRRIEQRWGPWTE
jgi:glycerol-1-phosphate dehydrogenase [NAD(P)+]